MPTSRIQENLEMMRNAGKGALLPYLTAGFPNAQTSERLIQAADATGAACVELGFPFSDSIADGPVIQESFHQVLSNGWTVEDTMNLVSRVRPAVECALIAMVSYTIVYRYGLDAFLDRAVTAGFDGLILPDVPAEEAKPKKQAADRAGLSYIGLVAPNTSPQRCETIVKHCSGFVYKIAVSGTTGERSQVPKDLENDVDQIRKQSGLPVCVGFGVSSAEHVRAVCNAADGAIVGSAIVRRVADGVRAGLPSDAIVDRVSDFMAELMTGTDSATA